jgi:hypothetical protein
VNEVERQKTTRKRGRAAAFPRSDAVLEDYAADFRVMIDARRTFGALPTMPSPRRFSPTPNSPTDNHRASVGTATGFETSSPKRRQSGHNVEARLDCTLVGILVGPRITEIGGHAIADEKADLPFMALNQLCAYFLK